MAEEKVVPDFDQVVIGPNQKGYGNSVWLGLVGGVFYAPGSLARILKEPAVDLLTGLAKVFVGVPIWALGRVSFVALGFIGLVTHRGRKI